MKRFIVIEKGEYEERNDRKVKIVRYIVLKDREVGKIVKVEKVLKWVKGIDDSDFDATIKLYINNKEPIYYDPIDRKWEWRYGTRGQQKSKYANICKYLGISKKELPTYLGLVSLFDKH